MIKTPYLIIDCAYKENFLNCPKFKTAAACSNVKDYVTKCMSYTWPQADFEYEII